MSAHLCAVVPAQPVLVRVLPCFVKPISEHEARRHQWHADVLTFIRDQIEPGETYRLGAADVEFAELLPEKPDVVAQAEDEECHELSTYLRQLARSVEAHSCVCTQDPDFKATTVEKEGGPEIIHIERR